MYDICLYMFVYKFTLFFLSFLLPLQESLPDVMDKVPNATFDEESLPKGANAQQRFLVSKMDEKG